MDPSKLKSRSLFLTLKTDPQFSTFVSVCTRCGLDQTLMYGGPYTLFAPSNKAFSRLLQNDFQALLMLENRDHLVALLTFHIIPIEIPYIYLKSGKMRTLSGKKCEVVRNNETVQIHSSTIVDFDIACENGILHVIDQLIFPGV